MREIIVKTTLERTPSRAAARLRLYLAGIGAALMMVTTLVLGTATPAMAWPSQISGSTSLDVGEHLVSPNGRFQLSMQDNGNLVLRRVSDAKILWHPNADGLGAAKLKVSSSGNAVLYQSDGDIVWASGTTRWPGGTVLYVSNSGNVVLRKNDGTVVWRVGTDPAIHGVEAMIEYATAQVGKPYALGSHGPTHFDCSGLTYKAMQAGGFDIGGHRSANTQYTRYAHIPWGDKRRGDLLFYDWTGDGHIDHVATYLGDGQMIHTWEKGTPLQVTGLWTSDHTAKVARPFV